MPDPPLRRFVVIIADLQKLLVQFDLVDLGHFPYNIFRFRLSPLADQPARGFWNKTVRKKKLPWIICISNTIAELTFGTYFWNFYNDESRDSGKKIRITKNICMIYTITITIWSQYANKYALELHDAHILVVKSVFFCQFTFGML